MLIYQKKKNWKLCQFIYQKVENNLIKNIYLLFVEFLTYALTWPLDMIPHGKL